MRTSRYGISHLLFNSISFANSRRESPYTSAHSFIILYVFLISRDFDVVVEINNINIYSHFQVHQSSATSHLNLERKCTYFLSIYSVCLGFFRFMKEGICYKPLLSSGHKHF